MSGSSPQPSDRRRRWFPLVWLGSAVAAVLLVLGVAGSLSGFSASITNNSNTVASGTLTMSETGVSGVGGTSTCDSPDATCALNKFGGQTAMVPDTTTLTGTAPNGTIPAGTDTDQNVGVVDITNTGSIPASALTVTGGTCAATSGTGANLCGVLDVAVYASATAPTAGTASTYGTQVFYGTATTLATETGLDVAAPVPAGSSEYLTFVVWIDSSATNADQGLTASEPLTWTLTQ